ncbi:beta-1,3-galactosyltransferase 2-like [Pelobates fuscus]|uniref:beta-1,3-galactosyltransferase 2-like n=1 Tax=Pelobates fuscus TaxID=191477 RepID=UPI002FE42FCD
MLFWKRIHCCPHWLKRLSRTFVSSCFTTGFVFLVFLLFMLLMLSSYSWFPRKFVNEDNLKLHNIRVFKGKKSNINNSAWIAKNMVYSSSHEKPQDKTSQSTQRLLQIMPMGQLRASSQGVQFYDYIINEPMKCQTHIPFLILLIAATPQHLDARQAIRQTWGNENVIPGVQVVRLFLLGRNTQQAFDIEQAITSESMQYHDIIQQEYLDTYNNLTTKTLMGMNWVATYCPHAHYVMKTDTDMFVNTEYLINKLLKPDLPPRTNYFTGSIMKGYAPNRNKDSKWYMPPDLYPGDMYPVFCSGTGYVFSGELAEKIFKITLTVKHLPLEDVYIGICLDKLGIKPVPPPSPSDFNHWRVAYSDCMYNRIVTSHDFKPPELVRYWNQLQQNRHTCA